MERLRLCERFLCSVADALGVNWVQHHSLSTPQCVRTNLKVLEGEGGVRLTYPQPLVHTLPMELVAAGQDSQQLAGLEITHAHHTPVARRTNTSR